MEKFDKLKEQITDSSQRFAIYQAETEAKKMENTLLETQIQNIKLCEAKREKTRNQINEEKQRMVK